MPLLRRIQKYSRDTTVRGRQATEMLSVKAVASARLITLYLSGEHRTPPKRVGKRGKIARLKQKLT